MQVKDAMSRNCEAVSKDTNLREAAKRMRDKDIGMLLVRDEGGKLQGLITDRDIAIRAVAEGKGIDSPVHQFMSQGVVSCYEDSDLEQAAQLMEQKQVRRLMVCDRQDQPVGVLAQGDVARALGKSSLTGEMVKEISKPSGQQARH